MHETSKWGDTTVKINLEQVYDTILEHIKTMDFSKLWNGFQPLRFALYTADECFFDGAYVVKTDEFLGNTAISYHGEMIAIWNVSEEVDSRILASKLIHEMFHGFQQLNHESRFPDELDALYRYRYEDLNLSLKLEENRLLADLLEQFDAEKWSTLLKMRRLRANRFPYEYRYEACIEQIEGTAEFVELNALKQLSTELYLQKRALLQHRITDKSNLLPIRIISYDVGALLLLLCNEQGLPYQSDFVNTTFSESLIEDLPAYNGPVEQTMKPCLDGYYEAASRVISQAIAKNDVVAEGMYDLLGVNVYNAVYDQNHIISRYFVMYGEDSNRRVEYGDFVIETNEYKKASKIYRI